MWDFVLSSWHAIVAAVAGLIAPALFFLALAIIVKGRSWVADIKRALPETGLNAQIILFNVLFSIPLIALAVTWFHGVMKASGLILVPASFWEAMPAWLVIFVAIFVGDFVAYWRHRLEHSALFWPAHAVHHSDTEMTWLSLERFHPINLFTTFVIDSTALLALGLPPFAIIANNIVRHYYGYLIHADLPWTYGWFGKVFVSPAMHRWHHAADVQAFDTNYATVFSIFDRTFGTWRVPGPCTSPLGVTDDMEPTLAAQMLYAFKPRAYRRLFRKFRKVEKPTQHPAE